MPARLLAANSCPPLEPGFRSGPSFHEREMVLTAAGDVPDSREMSHDIHQALHANLARGFLESEDRFRQIADALHDVVALSDERFTRLYFVNSAYERIWGRPRQELYANPLAFLAGVHPEDLERVRGAILEQRNGQYDVEFRVLRPSGPQRWVWSRGFPVRDANGDVYRIASITEDITDRVQVLESHERLIRGFTHDIRDPLGAADGYLSLLEMGVFGEMSAIQTQNIVGARRCIRSALGLVAQLLEIERAEAGQLTVERERVDLCATTRDIVEGFRAAATQKELDLTTLLPRDEDSLIVESDAARVRQVLANLISNAVKYTQRGGRVTVRAFVAAEGEGPRHGRWVGIAVVDNGPGIPLEKQNLLFREFTRFNPAAAEGSGIGLAISQQLARVLGASIAFQSTPGVGSTFTLWLPSDRPAVGAD
jgi:PAS domain S-box-containing protein